MVRNRASELNPKPVALWGRSSGEIEVQICCCANFRSFVDDGLWLKGSNL
jgi:hypothetical protein